MLTQMIKHVEQVKNEKEIMFLSMLYYYKLQNKY